MIPMGMVNKIANTPSIYNSRKHLVQAEHPPCHLNVKKNYTVAHLTFNILVPKPSPSEVFECSPNPLAPAPRGKFPTHQARIHPKQGQTP